MLMARSVFFTLQESPRFLAANNRSGECAIVLRRIAHYNNQPPSWFPDRRGSNQPSPSSGELISDPEASQRLLSSQNAPEGYIRSSSDFPQQQTEHALETSALTRPTSLAFDGDVDPKTTGPDVKGPEKSIASRSWSRIKDLFRSRDRKKTVLMAIIWVAIALGKSLINDAVFLPSN